MNDTPHNNWESKNIVLSESKLNNIKSDKENKIQKTFLQTEYNKIFDEDGIYSLIIALKFSI